MPTSKTDVFPAFFLSMNGWLILVLIMGGVVAYFFWGIWSALLIPGVPIMLMWFAFVLIGKHSEKPKASQASRGTQRPIPAILRDLSDKCVWPSFTIRPGRELYDPMHSSNDYSYEKQIVLEDGRAALYPINQHEWVLRILTGRHILEERAIRVDPEKTPDKLVFETLRDCANWSLGTSLSGELFTLMTSGRKFDSRNPILIGDLACIDFNGEEWSLRIMVSWEEQKVFRIPVPVEPDIDNDVSGTLSSVLLHGPTGF